MAFEKKNYILIFVLMAIAVAGSVVLIPLDKKYYADLYPARSDATE